MKEERNIITMNEFGNVVMPKDIQATAMRVGALRVVQCNRPDYQGRDKDTLQERHSE